MRHPDALLGVFGRAKARWALLSPAPCSSLQFRIFRRPPTVFQSAKSGSRWVLPRGNGRVASVFLRVKARAGLAVFARPGSLLPLASPKLFPG